MQTASSSKSPTSSSVALKQPAKSYTKGCISWHRSNNLIVSVDLNPYFHDYLLNYNSFLLKLVWRTKNHSKRQKDAGQASNFLQSSIYLWYFDFFAQRNSNAIFCLLFVFFFKEINRVRKAALTFGFFELFDGLAVILERELIYLNTSNPPNTDTILQLSHCVTCLRAPEYRDFRKDIQPFVGNAPFHRKFNK